MAGIKRFSKTVRSPPQGLTLASQANDCFVRDAAIACLPVMNSSTLRAVQTLVGHWERYNPARVSAALIAADEPVRGITPRIVVSSITRVSPPLRGRRAVRGRVRL